MHITNREVKREMVIRNKVFESKLSWLVNMLRDGSFCEDEVKESIRDQIFKIFKEDYQVKLIWTPDNPLSFMEFLCLALLFVGKGIKQVASILYLSEYTVVTYERRIRSKLNVKNRQAVSYVALCNGFLTMVE